VKGLKQPRHPWLFILVPPGAPLERRAKGNENRAITDYNKAIELEPRYAPAHNNRGIAYSVQGKFKEAIEDYSQAIQIDPANATAHLNRGFAKLLRGDEAEAFSSNVAPQRGMRNFSASSLSFRNGSAKPSHISKLPHRGEPARAPFAVTMKIHLNCMLRVPSDIATGSCPKLPLLPVTATLQLMA
jgi:hypothetical protein